MGLYTNYPPDVVPPNVPSYDAVVKPVPDSANAGAYRDVGGDTSYGYDPGILILPVASLTPKVAKVRVHGGYGTRSIKFAGIKRDTPPILPVARDIRDPIRSAGSSGQDNVTDTLIGAGLTILQPVPNPTGLGYDWTVAGEYTYVTTRPASQGGPRVPGHSVMPACRMPYPVSPQDPAAYQIIGGSIGGAADVDALYQSNTVSPSQGDIQKGNYVWPFTVLAPAFFDPNTQIG